MDNIKRRRKEVNLDLNDLISEANALEKQLHELQTQLKINYMNIPSKEQGKRAGAVAIEQISATEEEIGYVRNSLKKTYRHIVSMDIMCATTHHIEDKIWRHILYAEIEGVRNKLRKTKTDDPVYPSLQKTFFQKIDSAFKFYRDLNSKIKSTYHVDTKVLGIDLFKGTSAEDKVGMVLQFNYICMGDLARYQAQQYMLMKHKASKEYWSLAKTCYLKAIDVYRKTGKAYSQLALVSISNASAIDVVWYYCMSLSVKYPSTVGRDNLKSFYSKIRLNTTPKESVNDINGISQFVELFLHMHRTVMFQEKESEDFNTITPIITQLSSAVSGIIHKEQEDKVLHILRTTLTRTVTILLISIWILGERMKDKANYNRRNAILSSQLYLYTFVFQLFSILCKHIRESLDETKDDKMDRMVEESLLPALSIWCTYICTNMTPIANYCMTAQTDSRNREPEKKLLLKAIQSLLSILISHTSFPDPGLNILPPTYPLSEDVSLLGIVPLSTFHMKIDFFKENAYDVVDHTPEARKQVRWGRIREMIKKMADSNSFEFIHYNQNEQKYSIIDENAKRQQQSRFMKALATQRLMEQVSSLEKNVNRMSLSTKEEVKDVYTCVVDITAFLDGLDKVKKWANQTLNGDRRSQGSILEVIVPLEVIDSLDDHKKGTSHMNLQARESIRYLDQKLLEASSHNNPTASFLRTQKVNEKLSDWNESEKYWIGEESRSDVVNELLQSEGEEGSDGSSLEDLLSRRRADSSEEEESESEEEVEVEEYKYEDIFEEDEPYTYADVPKAYQPIISCLLYYQQSHTPDHLVLVTNDEDLTWWAELFGDVSTGRRLMVKTVDEWNKIVSTIDFEKAYEHSWRHR